MERSASLLIRASCGVPSTFSSSFWISFGRISFPIWMWYPKLLINVLSFFTLSSSGASWVRYKNGISLQKYSSATVSFAASIKSSIIFVATFRSYGFNSTGLPCSSRIIFVSGKFFLRSRSSPETSAICSNIGTSFSYFCLSCSSCASRIFATLV